MSLIEAELVDDFGGEIKAIWFNQPFLIKVLKPSQEFFFIGKINWDFKGKRKTLTVTQYEPISDGPMILPVYSETEGITSNYLRKLIKLILTYNPTPGVGSVWLEEYLPEEIIKQENLIGLDEAIRKIHFPQNSVDIEVAKKRLSFDELFLIILRMLQIKNELIKNSAIALKFKHEILKKFVKSLPFKLTDAQRKAAWEIIKDLSRSIPMNRLLEGDVGSGKTVVAAMAVLVMAKNNYQSVWLAPTEILANQHYQNVSKLLSPQKIKTGLLTADTHKANLENDDLIIGTHALLQKNIHIPNLALIIIDEQHRFGVKQRAHLRQTNPIYEMGSNRLEAIPHLLSMTATPIPRTLALSLYGDLDVSVIDELPPDRKKIITKIISPQNRKQAYDFIRNQIKNGRQAFVICPLIEKQNENMQFKDTQGDLFQLDRKCVIDEHKKLSEKIFPEFNIGLLHGRLKMREKEKVMKNFYRGKLDILVSTAVVEVGVDVPNATVMMIEGAERFGLAQLHQFRGRVGRSKYQSYCLLFSENYSETNEKRLGAMTVCGNGFELAEIDLKMRGPGELAGIRQSGLPDLKMSSLSDIMLINKVRAVAEKIIQRGLEKYPKIISRLKEFDTQRHLE